TTSCFSFFFSSRRRHTISKRDWSSDVCSSDLVRYFRTGLVLHRMGGSSMSIDLDSLTSWDADWSQLSVVVTGIGVTGFSVADTLAELGAAVLVLDGKDTVENRQAADTLKIVGVKDVLLGDNAVAGLPEASAI